MSEPRKKSEAGRSPDAYCRNQERKAKLGGALRSPIGADKVKKLPEREDARQLPPPGIYYEKVYSNNDLLKFSFGMILLYAEEMKFSC